MNAYNRLLLSIAYIGISVVLILLFGGFSSSGPVQSFCILASWAALVAVRFLSFGGWLAFLIVFDVYLLILFVLNCYLRRKIRFALPLIPFTIHGLGVYLCLQMPGRDELDTSFITNLLAWIIPICVAFFYFYLDWQLAKKDVKRESST